MTEAPAAYIELRRGGTVTGVPTACFGYAYDSGASFCGEWSNGYNPELVRYVAAAAGAPEIGARLAPLSGIFGGWHYDGEALHVFADQLGCRPVYVRIGADFVSVGSRLSVLLPPEGPEALRPDLGQRDFFLRHGYYSGSGTAYEEVYQIWGAHVYTIDADLRIAEAPYVSWSFVGRDEPVSGATLSSRTWSQLQRSVDHAGRDADRLVIPLSGGLDSRTLAVLAAARWPTRVRSLNYGDAGTSDAVIAHAIAEALELPHAYFPFDYGTWVSEARANIAEAEGQLSAALLLPPRDAIATIGPHDIILSGVGGNATLGGLEGVGDDLAEAVIAAHLHPLQMRADNHFPLPALLRQLPPGPYRHQLLWLALRTRRAMVGSGLCAQHGRYRLPLLEWGLLRVLYGQPASHRRERCLHRAVGLAYFPEAILALPLAKDGRRLGESRYTLRSGLKSLRYRTAKALGRDLNPPFFRLEEVWRRHGTTIREIAMQYESPTPVPPTIPRTPPKRHELLLWFHHFTLAVCFGRGDRAGQSPSQRGS